MTGVTQKFAGIDALCKYYQELGIKATILPEKSPEAIEKGRVKQDMGYIKVSGREFDLATIRMKGTTSGSYDLGKVRGIPIATKQKIPIEYHHIVRANFANEGALKAKLKKKTKGVIGKEVTDVSWEGGRLAEALNSDDRIKATVLRFIQNEDNIKTEPDKKNKILRIVFSRPSEIKSGLAFGFKFDRHLYPREAVDVMDRIAIVACNFTGAAR